MGAVGLQWYSARPKRKPKGYWHSVAHQRAFLENFAKEHGIRDAKGWEDVRGVDLAHDGGRTLLRLHDNKLLRLLQCAFPEQQWDPSAFTSRAPREFWIDKSNRRALLEKVAREMDVQAPEEWGCVGRGDVRRLGGAALLHIHNQDMRAMLEDAFPEVKWAPMLPERAWTPDPFCSRRKRRAFFDAMAKERAFSSAEGWEGVKRAEVYSCGGKRLLDRFYGDLRSALEDAYPELDFSEMKIQRPPRPRLEKGLLDDPREQRRLLDEIAARLGITSAPADWRGVSSLDVVDKGGVALLQRHGSLFKALSAIYHEQSWDLFESRPSVSHGYWENDENVISLMKKAKRELQIASDEEWARVSYAQLRTVPGAASMLSHLTLREALRRAFGLELPSVCIDAGKRSSQHQLWRTLSSIF